MNRWLASFMLIIASACSSTEGPGGGGGTDVCAGVDCSGHGRCAVVAQTMAVCLCDPGFHADGESCVANQPGAECQGVTCSGHGVCAVNGGAPICACDATYRADGAVACVPEACTLSPCAEVAVAGVGFARVIHARDNGALYWGTDGKIRMRAAGGAAPVDLANVTDPTVILSDAGAVYYGHTSGLWRLADGQTTPTAVGGQAIEAVVLDGSTAFWLDRTVSGSGGGMASFSRKLWSAPTTGGMATDVAHEGSPSNTFGDGLALVGSEVYYADESAVRHVPKTGISVGTLPTLLTALGGVSALVPNGNQLIALVTTADAQGVQALPLDGTAPQVLAPIGSANGNGRLYGPILSQGNVYWGDRRGVFRVPVGGGTAVQLVSAAVTAIASDGQALYYADGTDIYKRALP